MASLMLFTGKGGVGKSTISAATAIHHAQEGLKTILVSSDPAHSTDDTLGVNIGNGTLVQISDNLWAKNINAEANAHLFADEMKKGMEAMFAKQIPGFDSEIFTDMTSFPGMDEFFALDEILKLVQSCDYDIIVFDTAPTGHTLKALNAPAAIRTFLLRILRMKAKIDNLKSFMLKKGDTPKLIAHLEDICAKVERLTLILRNPKFVNINLVSIASEAGFQECFRTIQFLKKMEIPVGNIIVNNIMPNFGDTEWALAEDHPSVGLVHREYVMQQPYLQRYRELCSEENLKLVGLSRLPFEPRAEKLGEVAKMLWRPGSLSWEPILPVTETDTGYRVQLPFVGDAKWKVKSGTAKYQYESFNFGQGDGWYEVPVEDVKRKRKINEDTVTLTTE
jgi:arsenite/tail-anchored protein-transporting ATPase